MFFWLWSLKTHTFSGMQAWSSSRSLRQISRWSSPAPAMMCSPDSSMMHWHHGVGLGQAFQSLHQFGQVSGVLGLHRHSGPQGWRWTSSHAGCGRARKCWWFPVLIKYWSTPTRPTMLPTWHFFDGLDVTAHHQKWSWNRALRIRKAVHRFNQVN